MDELDRAHALLGTRPGATRDEIRRAFRDAAKRRHPDLGGEATDFIDLRDAMTVLIARAPRVAEPVMPSSRAAAHYVTSALTTTTPRRAASMRSDRPRRASSSSFATVLARHLATS